MVFEVHEQSLDAVVVSVHVSYSAISGTYCNTAYVQIQNICQHCYKHFIYSLYVGTRWKLKKENIPELPSL